MKNTEAILVRPGLMEIREAALPPLRAGELLIRITDVGVCGSDVHGFACGPYIPPKDPNQKIGLGHECAGIVAAVSEGSAFQVGERVLIEPGVPCGSCRFCLDGRYNLCTSMDFMATQPNYRGALTNYLVYPERMTYSLPASMSLMEGALVEPAAVGMHAAQVGGAGPGKKIVILGSGCIGLVVLQACRLFGASQIVVADLIDKRLAKAKELGATAVVNSKEQSVAQALEDVFGPGGADIVFETAGSPVTAKQTLDLVSRGGKIMIVGTIPAEVPIDFLKINREVTIQTVFRYANNFPMTIEAIASGKLDVTGLVTDEYNYEDVQRAFQECIDRKAEIIKAVIHIAEV